MVAAQCNELEILKYLYENDISRDYECCFEQVCSDICDGLSDEDWMQECIITSDLN